MYNLKILNFFLITVFTWFFANWSDAYALDIKTLRFGQHGNATRVVLDLDKEADFRATTADNPPRITVDMPAIAGQPTISRNQLPPIIKDIRLEPSSGNTSRLTFILNSPATIRSAFLMPGNAGTARLVIDAGPVSQTAFAQTLGRPYGTLQIREDGSPDAPVLPFAGIAPPQLDPISRPQAPHVDVPQVGDLATPQIKGQLPLVMIDPGHGGVDPGASGSNVREKDVTLAVAKNLRDALEKTGKYRVKLTRDRDVFIPLAERVRIARRAGADLFVSVHADSMPGTDNAHGASFYTLSDQASDAQTAKLAARENQADLLAGVDLPAQDKDVTTILIDLAMRETTTQSKRFAGALVKTFKNADVPMVPAPSRHAGFMVLKAPDIPSVLIELGFLSTPAEARKLDDSAWRDTLAGAIAGGIDDWFRTHKKP